MDQSKICKICKTNKSIQDFHNNNKNKDGIPDLMEKYNNAVFNFEKYGILPEIK